MKKSNLIIALCISATSLIQAVAQNSVEFEIHHKINGSDFGFNQESISPEGENFEVDRLEYYISEINITHDNGIVTEIDSFWILVQTDLSSTQVDLGIHAITNVEAISFSVGVDPDFNHLDPTQYATSHPLGPKSPSMHWGWSAGYRFVAMEGEETDGNEQFEIHALGDQNYFETTIEVEGVENNGTVSIPIYANYAEALNGIELKNGVITHGDFDEAMDLLENFRDYVFTAIEPIDSLPNDTTTCIVTLSKIKGISIVPNPSINGSIKLILDQAVEDIDRVEVYDIAGNLLSSMKTIDNKVNYQLNSLQSGVYFMRAFSSTGESFSTERTIVLN